jgi:HK97 family phage portal protein
MPWKRRQRKAAEALSGGDASPYGDLFGAAIIPGSPGVTGDVAGFAELVRRWREQATITAGGYPSTYGWAPYVSEWAARQVPALTASMRLISGICMQLPLRQKRGDTLVDPPAAVIRNPAPGPNRTVADFTDEYVSDVLLYGNYAALIGPTDSTGWPTQLVPLDVTTVSVARDPETLQPIYQLTGVDGYLDATRVFHVAIDKRSGELVGRGVLPTLSGAIGAALASDAYAGRYFTESGVPSGVITDTRPNLTQEQADELKGKWLAAVNGTPTPVVVPASTTFTPLAASADQAQLVQARQWDATMVAMILGVPPFLLGIETQRHTYTNAETEFGRFVATTIMRLLTPLEQQLTAQCLPAGNVAEFSTAALLRADTSSRAAAAVQLYGAEIITVAEARQLAGFAPAGGPVEADEPAPSSTAPVTGGQLEDDDEAALARLLAAEV